MRAVLHVGKKGIIIIPKKMREAVGLKEDSEVIAEVVGDKIVLRPFRPIVVDVDPEVVEKIFDEEKEQEARRYKEMFSDETGSGH